MRATFALILVLENQIAYADFIKSHAKDPAAGNSGFMQNPPKALKDKFPMCDAFLKVEWIDKEKRVGYSQFDVYAANGAKASVKNRIGPLLALVYLDENSPGYLYDLKEWERKRKLGLHLLFSRIRQGTLETEQAPENGGSVSYLGIEVKDKAGHDVISSDAVPEFQGPAEISLAKHSMNVCIPYPDNERMWIAEGKAIGKRGLMKKIGSERSNLNKDDVPFRISNSFFRVNFKNNGSTGYIGNGGALIYFYNGGYHVASPTLQSSGSVATVWAFKAVGRECKLEGLHLGTPFITTDGNSYFLDNKCNLNEAMEK